MKRFLLMAGLALPALPACVHANDFHRALTDTQLELHRAETRSGAARSTASDALLQRFVALEDAVKSDPVLLEKTQRLHAMARFQLVHGGRIGSLDLPPPVPSYRQAGAAGESCESPLPLNTSEALELQMQPGESLWIRVQGNTEKAIGVTTRGSRLDTRLSAWPDCRELVADPIASADDSIGLQAELTLHSDKQTFWLVRLDNLGDQPGTVILGGVDFSLVQGQVTRSADGTPFTEATVGMFRVVNGQYLLEGSTQVDAQGRYLLGYQQNGSYVFRTGNSWSSEPLAHEAWRDVPCVGRYESSMGDCTYGQTQPTPVPLNGGSVTLNFALDTLGTITGVVTDIATGAPLAAARLRLQSSESTSQSLQTYTDSLGRYRLHRTNGADSYLIADAFAYRTQLFDGVNCPQEICNFALGTLLRNDPAMPVLRADFALSRVPSLELEMRFGGVPAQEREYFLLTLFDLNGVQVYQRTFYGPRASIGDLAPGSYRARIQSWHGYSQLYSGIECLSECLEELSQATAIQFPASGPGLTVRFDLRPRPVLRGTIRDESSGEPVIDGNAKLYRTSGEYVDSVWTNRGQFELAGIRPGSYVLMASAPDYVTELFANVPCPRPSDVISCPGATPLIFTRESGDQEIQIDLTPNPLVTGRLTAGRPEPSFGAELQIVSSNGQVIHRAWVLTGAMGSYGTRSFPPSTGRIAATNRDYVDQVFPRIDCVSGWSSMFAGCDLPNAAVFDLRAGHTYDGIDFQLRPRTARGFRVVGAVDNAPLAGVGIDVWNSSGVRLQSLVSAADGMVYVGHNAFETRLLSTFNLLGLEDQVYSGIRCPEGPAYFGQCSLQGATPVPAPVNGSTLAPDIVIRMSDGIILFNHGFEN